MGNVYCTFCGSHPSGCRCAPALQNFVDERNDEGHAEHIRQASGKTVGINAWPACAGCLATLTFEPMRENTEFALPGECSACGDDLAQSLVFHIAPWRYDKGERVERVSVVRDDEVN